MPDRIDLNADVGEGAAADAALIPVVTSVNIACGGHAGDEATMRSAVRCALAARVAIGAHPGFDDRAGCGRHEQAVTPDGLRRLLSAQVGRLRALAAAEGARVTHIKPHGALYHQVARDRDLATAAARLVLELDAGLILVCPAGSPAVDWARDLGVRVAEEAFADRGYRADGSLVPRGEPGAELDSPDEAVRRAVRLVREGRVASVDGRLLSVRADTLCLHGDRPGAAEFAAALRQALRQAGIELRSLV